MVKATLSLGSRSPIKDTLPSSSPVGAAASSNGGGSAAEAGGGADCSCPPPYSVFATTTNQSSAANRLIRFFPMDVSEVTLPKDLERKLVNGIAEAMHETWSKGIIDRGFTFDAVRDEARKRHHLLIPFEELTDEDKAYDVDLARDTLKVLMKSGFAFKRTGKDMSKQMTVKLHESYRQPNGYLPRPLDDKSVKLSEDLLMLAEMLAENMHSVWGSKRMSEGWTYSRVADPLKRHSPNLLPYAELTEDARYSNRNSALTVLRMMSILGYSIVSQPPKRSPAKPLLALAGFVLILACYVYYVLN